MQFVLFIDLQEWSNHLDALSKTTNSLSSQNLTCVNISGVGVCEILYHLLYFFKWNCWYNYNYFNYNAVTCDNPMTFRTFLMSFYDILTFIWHIILWLLILFNIQNKDCFHHTITFFPANYYDFFWHIHYFEWPFYSPPWLLRFWHVLLRLFDGALPFLDFTIFFNIIVL